MRVVCIPAYNEAAGIQQFVLECRRYSDKVIVCDDGSFDETSRLAEEAGAEVIKHQKNRGKGAALRTLFSFARKLHPKVVVTIDGDGQFMPEEIEKVMNPVLNGKADIVIGCRFGDDTEMPKYRKFGNKVLDRMTNLASELPFRDTQSGFRAYSADALNSIEFVTDGFGADSEILVNASSKGLEILEKEVTVLYNTAHKTSTKDPISHSSGVIVSLIELIALKHPLKYLGLPGLVLIVLGIAYSIVVISIFNETRYFSVPSTLIAMGSLVIGLMMVLMSVVLYSIVRATKKPV